MLRALDISTSGLVAQRIRLDAISGNLANMSSVRNERGELQPYQERFVVFQPDDEVRSRDGAVGVKVSEVRQVEGIRRLSQHGHDESVRRFVDRHTRL